jgi:hypothetical protein
MPKKGKAAASKKGKKKSKAKTDDGKRCVRAPCA